MILQKANLCREDCNCFAASEQNLNSLGKKNWPRGRKFELSACVLLCRLSYSELQGQPLCLDVQQGAAPLPLCCLCSSSNPGWIPRLLKHGILGCCTQVVKSNIQSELLEGNHLFSTAINDQHLVLSQKRSPHTLRTFSWRWSHLLILVLNLLDLAPVIETITNVWLEPFLAKKPPQKPLKTKKPEKTFHKCLLWVKRGNTFSQWHLWFWKSVGQGESWCTETLISHSA